MTEYLPYSRQCLDEDDVAAVAAALRAPYLTTGPLVDRFEMMFAKAVGAEEAVVCNSGTAALHLAALLLDMQPGDVAIVPSVTFVATANAVRYVGGTVVFSDVEADTGMMGPVQLREALARCHGRQVRAVFPVHLGGQTSDLQAIFEITRANGISLVEDACHALGTTYGSDNVRVGAGAHADVSCFSLHPVKAVTMGEGGVLTVRDPRQAARARRLRSHGVTRSPADFVDAKNALAANGAPHSWYYEMQEIGFNYRATDFQCALGLSQLTKLERFNARRAEIVARYDAGLQSLAPIVRPVRRTTCRPGWHLYQVLVDFAALGLARDDMVSWLRKRNIGTQVHYIPVHLQPYYRQIDKISLPGAEAFYDRCLSLPMFPAMNDDDVDQVIRALGDLMKERGLLG